MTPQRTAPAGNGEGRSDQAGAGSGSSVQRETDGPRASFDAAALDLVAMDPRERAVFMAGFECGYLDRMTREHRTYAQAIEDLAHRYVVMLNLDERIAADLSSTIQRGPYADLADRRGEHECADQQRATLRRRGVWPVAS